jgi:hypothetical protein
MKRLNLFLSLSLAAMTLASTTNAIADTYEIVDLGSSNGNQVVGIDSQGAVVISKTSLNEFLTEDVVGGQLQITISSTRPTLSYDNGGSCSSPSGFDSTGETVCDNGYVGFASRDNANGDQGGIYLGSASDPTLLSVQGSVDGGFMNSSGDFAWTDGALEENFEAIDLTTDAPAPKSLFLLHASPVPEPGSLALLSTGILAGAEVVRRRWL